MCLFFPERLLHWGMLFYLKCRWNCPIDYARLTYLLAPLVREIMGIERRSRTYRQIYTMLSVY